MSDQKNIYPILPEADSNRANPNLASGGGGASRPGATREQAGGPASELGGGTGDLYGPAKRTGGWSSFSTAKRVRTGAPCDLGLCLSPGTPSTSSDDSVTTIGGNDKDEPLLLDLFV